MDSIRKSHAMGSGWCCKAEAARGPRAAGSLKADYR
jgi:hypothetical protein